MDKIVTKHSSKSSKLQKDKHDLDLPYSLVHATHQEQKSPSMALLAEGTALIKATIRSPMSCKRKALPSKSRN